MSVSYDETNLATNTASGRLNAVRFLVGDTDTNKPLVQDEEINFALSQTGDNVYYGSSYIASTIASKFARKVNTQVDGAISADYSDLSKQYKALSSFLKQEGLKYSSGGLGVSAGGISRSQVESVRNLGDRVSSSFYRGQFSHSSVNDYIQGDYD